jgi:hypothetical protein
MFPLPIFPGAPKGWVPPAKFGPFVPLGYVHAACEEFSTFFSSELTGLHDGSGVPRSTDKLSDLLLLFLVFHFLVGNRGFFPSQG